VILRNALPERLRELIKLNLTNLATLLRLNATRDIRLFRISSDVIPFASHPVNGVPWWREFASELREIAETIRGEDIRVSMHVGPYTVLSSPNGQTLAASVADLEYHARFLDAVSFDVTHKIIVHGGGVYGDKAASMQRWSENVQGLPANIRDRLTVENDERLYGSEDAFALSRTVKIPWVFDVFHHRVFAGENADVIEPLELAAATWSAIDGVPKIHYSSQAEGSRPGAHADYVLSAEFEAFLSLTRDTADFDCMLEAKAKDCALLDLRRDLYLSA
jgi:UV DNA damage endonuclease